MKILALDPSSSCTGWAFSHNGKIQQAGFMPFAISKIHGDKYLEIYNWTRNKLLYFNPDLVLIEGYYFSRRFATGTSVNSEIRGVMKMVVRELGISYEVIDPAKWKKTLCGRATPTRSQKRKWGKNKSKKMMTVKVLKDEYSVSIPNKVFNPRTGKKINFKYDATDAIGILMGYQKWNNIKIKWLKDTNEMWALKTIKDEQK